MAATSALATTTASKEFPTCPTKTSSNATAPSKKIAILDLPDELRDNICRQLLLELYENEGLYAEKEVSLLEHIRAFRKKINTLNMVPGFTAPKILAKKNIHPVPTQFLWSTDFPSKIRIGHTIKDINHDTI
ncbi:hypothetical protein E2P81_ATG05652 [Venturia nashicola]|uniref:Uncharacterized protein n=1 Tax=Venturia nashicola TaxID=86259 RepID=A0A4Z1P8J9_9PEZI|nr:hypothetical protein E6O75_ATG05791 [Venturia nashicola]TLD32676.1 hypothetical protein E2P81_ATG05652 [Venturia nashicola]